MMFTTSGRHERSSGRFPTKLGAVLGGSAEHSEEALVKAYDGVNYLADMEMDRERAFRVCFTGRAEKPGDKGSVMILRFLALNKNSGG